MYLLAIYYTKNVQILYQKIIKYQKGEIIKMKKLPELYKNNNIKPIDNNKKVYYMKNEDMRKISNTSVEEELDNIFHGLGYSYNIPVELVTTKKTYHTSLVTKTKENVVTIDNIIIPISEIISITKK